MKKLKISKTYSKLEKKDLKVNNSLKDINDIFMSEKKIYLFNGYNSFNKNISNRI